MLNNFNHKKGFTLVELMVATAVFMSVMVVSVSSLIIIINTNRHTESVKTVVDNVTFAIDSISRNLRNATRLETDSYQCYPNTGSDCPAGVSEISAVVYYTSTATTTIFYKFIQNPTGTNDGNIQKCDTHIHPECPNSGSGWQSMTAPTSVVSIDNMTFYVLGQEHANDASCNTRTQPRVIITAYGSVISKNGDKTKFNVQTTSSRRSRNSNSCTP